MLPKYENDILTMQGGMYMIQNVVEVKNISKKYKEKYAVQNMQLSIKKGEIFGLIGRNGAGKSTLLKMIAGLIHPSEGNITLFGKNPITDALCYRRVGSLIENCGLYPNMNAYDNLKMKSICLGYQNEVEIKDALTLVGLQNVGNKKIKNYSLGMKQRLGIAMALIGNPDLLILDEPINGLDPQGIQEIREIITKLNEEQNMTIIISSHILGELSKVASSYGILNDGHLVQHITKDELSQLSRHYVIFKVDDVKKASYVLEETFQVTKYEVLDDTTIAIYERMEEACFINQNFVKHDIMVTSFIEKKEDLETYFLALMGGGSDAK